MVCPTLCHSVRNILEPCQGVLFPTLSLREAAPCKVRSQSASNAVPGTSGWSSQSEEKAPGPQEKAPAKNAPHEKAPVENAPKVEAPHEKAPAENAPDEKPPVVKIEGQEKERDKGLMETGWDLQ